ncbi:MAG: hypothetical protein ACPK85_07210 [Methanosarcina sp.]
MKGCNHLKTLIPVFFTSNCLHCTELTPFPHDEPKNHEKMKNKVELENNSKLKNLKNPDSGRITLFSQTYSNNIIPGNVFLAKISGNKIYDKLYSVIYGTLKTQLHYDSVSNGLKYSIIRDRCLTPYALLPVADTFLDSGIKKCKGKLKNLSETCEFCNAAEISLTHYVEQPRQAEPLYICGLTPMIKSTYEISIGINTDNPCSFIELNTPGSKLIIQEINSKVLLKSLFKVSSTDIKSKTIDLGNPAEKINFKVLFDGDKKINTIYSEDGNYIETPFYDFERQKLPYADFSKGYIKFTPFPAGKYLDFKIYSIIQRADRKFITAIGSSTITAFGLDGPHVRNTTEKGISYLNSKNHTGTIWFDIELLEQCSEEDLEYLRSLVLDKAWDVGVHYSKELNSLPPNEAYKVMDEGYSYVYEKIGHKPTTWCSMRNRDNIAHAIYAYDVMGMFWRNGDSGVHTERDLGNLDDETWEWWDPASNAGMSYPVFTHELDQDPAIKYSISFSKFQKWIDNYNSSNVSIVSFYEYIQINRNSYDASFEILENDENIVTFKAHTNRARALVNVGISVEKNIQVCDNNREKFLDYKVEQDNSITFWVEDDHTYSIYLQPFTTDSGIN